MTRPRALRIAARAAAALVLALIAVEVALRALGLAPRAATGYPEGLFVPEPDATFALAPGFSGAMDLGEERVAIRTNAHGFRDDAFEPRAPDASRRARVLALGDSFGFGHGVAPEQSYPEVLGAALGADVLNLGVPGYNTRQELATLRRLGPELAPDLVLVGVYVGNDVSGNLERRQAPPRARHGVLVAAAPGEPEWRVTLRAGVLRGSLIARHLQRWRRGRHLRAVESSEGGLIGALCGTLDWDAGTALEVFRRAPTADGRAALERTAELLLEMHAYARDALGVPLAVVLLPSPFQYDPRWLALAHEHCGLDPADYDLEIVGRRLLALDAEDPREGPAVLDLLPAFRARALADPSATLYLDVHFNAAGHALAAEQIAGFLAARGLVGSKR